MMNYGEEKDAEAEEEFYDSLDRILSSSCSSTSASTSEDEDEVHSRRRRRRRSRDSSMYDVWISEPSSVAERRRRLLWQMGLFTCSSPQRNHEDRDEDGDRATLRGEMERLALRDGIHCEWNSSSLPSISRSTLDCASPDLLAEQKLLSSLPEESPVLHLDEERKDCSENGHKNHEFCFTIKNLNSGEKFVVKELREDGTWKRLREEGTGRHLTMEEFQVSVIGLSPIVQEVMRRQSVEQEDDGRGNDVIGKRDITCSNGVALIGDRWMRKKKGNLLRCIKTVAGSVIQRKKKQIDYEGDTSSEKGGRRSSSTTDDSLSRHSHYDSERIKVRKFGKSTKDLTALSLGQEIQAHKGAIWSMKFNIDGRYLASAGEDRIIRVWQVIEKNCIGGGSGEIPKAFVLEKSLSYERTVAPEFVFGLSKEPVCSFEGHLADVLDLSWSKCEVGFPFYLSKSMIGDNCAD